MSLVDTNTKNDVSDEFVSLIEQGNRIVSQLSTLRIALLNLKSTVNLSDIFTADEETEVDNAIAQLVSDITDVIT
jgi:hypothetical protein